MYDTPLIGFPGNMVIFKGIITLLITIGKVPHQVVYMIDFIIVDYPGAYNIILGRSFLAANKVMVPMHYYDIKIPTARAIITINEDQKST